MKRNYLPENLNFKKIDKRDHGGNIYELKQKLKKRNLNEEVMDFSVNINPLGFPDSLRPLISIHLENLLQYPDQEYTNFREAIAEKHGITADHVWPGNGASELIFNLPRICSFKKCIIPIPCYSDYLYAAQSIRLPVVSVPSGMELSFRPDYEKLASFIDKSKNILFIGQPSNPAGSMNKNEDIIKLAGMFPDTLFCIDESFADYVEDYKSLTEDMIPNMVIIRSMTKIFAVPGLRLGYVIAHPDIVVKLKSILPTWSVNSLAAALGPELIREDDYIKKTISIIKDEREKVFNSLLKLKSFTPYPSNANYMTVEINNDQYDAEILAGKLLERGIVIRCLNKIPGLGENFFRIAVRKPAENDLLLEALKEIDSDKLNKKPAGKIKKNTGSKKPLMILGTSSNSGKSILATAFCRIFYNDGIRVAPFKAQNMSLNSFVTADGGEMGRAQVLQAQASFLPPDTRMNPVLLKPNSQTGSQIIVMGKPVGNMKAAEYYNKKRSLWEEVKNAYDSLAEQFDLIVLEGAGSPAEINLKENDIVNMKMAAYSKASALLAGDIDRGGIYASFFGTMELFTYEERKLIEGYLINKFRGDASLLNTANDYLLKYTGKPVLGIIPMLKDLILPEEDSVSFKESFKFQNHKQENINEKIVIIIVDFPHISNFTDFDALKRENDVYIQIVRSDKDIPVNWDIFILPGSKNVINDLNFLKKTGIAEYLIENAGNFSGEIIGICGGFQMLGKEVFDPAGIESNLKKEKGLSLLNMSTVMMKEKLLQQTEAVFIPTADKINGYEIHHGETKSNSLKTIIKDNKNRIIGYSNESGTIWGTYLHGIFDNSSWRSWFLSRYRKGKAKYNLNINSSDYDLNMEIDRLAEIVRKNVDMEKIYRNLGF